MYGGKFQKIRLYKLHNYLSLCNFPDKTVHIFAKMVSACFVDTYIPKRIESVKCYLDSFCSETILFEVLSTLGLYQEYGQSFY